MNVCVGLSKVFLTSETRVAGVFFAHTGILQHVWKLLARKGVFRLVCPFSKRRAYAWLHRNSVELQRREEDEQFQRLRPAADPIDFQHSRIYFYLTLRFSGNSDNFDNQGVSFYVGMVYESSQNIVWRSIIAHSWMR